MKIFDLILKLSFLSYPAVMIARPYVTAQTWADCLALFFAMSVCICCYYIYIFFAGYSFYLLVIHGIYHLVYFKADRKIKQRLNNSL